jgi:hypothetical protein
LKGVLHLVRNLRRTLWIWSFPRFPLH